MRAPRNRRSSEQGTSDISFDVGAGARDCRTARGVASATPRAFPSAAKAAVARPALTP
jgi:hypothetical protein